LFPRQRLTADFMLYVIMLANSWHRSITFSILYNGLFHKCDVCSTWILETSSL